MTPEQEQWLIQAIQNHDRILENQQIQIAEIRNEITEIRVEITEIRNEITEIRAETDEIKRQNAELRINNSEIREGQAMLADYLREAMDRSNRFNQESLQRHELLVRQINDLRQDFLNHMRTYHPPNQ